MMRSSRVGAGRMLRATSQAVASAKEPFSLAATARASAAADLRAVTVPSPLPPAAAAAAASAAPTSPTFAAAGSVAWSDWESVNHGEAVEEEEEELAEFWYLDTAPRADEVEAAIWSLQQMSIPSSYQQETYNVDNDDDDEHSNSDAADREINSVPRTSAEPESDWIEPTFHATSEISAPNNCYKALEAFHLLKVNPSIQRMVVSLSSDRAVWDAVMKNEAVQEIKKSLREGIADAKAGDSTGPVESIVSALGSIYSNTKTTVMELIEKVATFVNNLVNSSEKEGDKESEFFADAVKSSLMLSVFVFLIVVVGRLHK